MPHTEHDREDLLREATALVERAELQVNGWDAPVVVGGYDVDPEWLRGVQAVSGSLAAWLELPGKQPHLPCV